jgi:hypothetical protein
VVANPVLEPASIHRVQAVYSRGRRVVERAYLPPQEILQRHVAALTAGDLDSLAADYAEDALVLTTSGDYRGRAAIRELFAGLSQALPEVTLEAQSTAFAGDVLLLHWTANSALNTVPDGVDTFIFNSGAIQVQTISCTLTPKP